MFGSLAGAALRHPRRLLWAAVAVVLIGFAAGGAVANGLSTGLGDYDDPGSSTARAEADVRTATGIDLEQGYLLLIRTGGAIDPGAAPPPIVLRAEAVLQSRPEVRGVLDFASTGDRTMIASNGRDTYVAAQVGGFDGNAQKGAVHALQAALERDPVLRGRTSLGGPTTANVQVTEISTVDLGLAEAVAFPIMLVLLLLAFRRPVAALLPLIGATYTIAVAFLGIAAVTLLTDLSVFALNLMFALGIGLAVDFSMLVVFRFREELDTGADVPESIRRTLAVTGRTVLFSVLTVSGALASLLLFPQRFLYSMGVAGILTTLAAGSFALLVLPALLALLGRRAGHRRAARSGGGWYRFAQLVMRRPVLFACAAVVVLLTAGLPVTGLRFTGVDSGVLPADSSAGQVFRELRTAFPATPAAPIHLIVTAPESAGPALADYANRVGTVPGVTARPPVRLGGGLWEVQATTDAAPLTGAARADLREIGALSLPYRVRATGQTAQFQSMQDSLGSHLGPAVGLVAIVTLGLLLAMTRSILLPLKALVMSGLSLCAALGTLVFVFQDGHLQGLLGFSSEGALESTSPIILCAVAFGLSTDYTVFLLSRIKEYHDSGLPCREAVARGLDRTGRIVTLAAILLCVPIGALTISRLTFIKELGLGTAVAVFVDATIVRAVLVPALMAILKNANWWPGGARRRKDVPHRDLQPAQAAREPHDPRPGSLVAGGGGGRRPHAAGALGSDGRARRRANPPGL